ncbi:MAG: ArsB/NhaD family transporter [Acidaminococcaceae bacterium]
MANNTVLAIAIFIAAYILIISEKINRMVVALSGAVIMIMLGIINQEQALSHIDFNTIGLLIGMMITVNITSETGIYKFMAIWAAKKAKARPMPLMFALACLTAVFSAFLDNVTTVLLIVPVTFGITSQLKLDVKPFLVCQILASNIGGAATLIGDPPNIMVSSAAGFDFMAFIINLAPVCIFVFLICMFILYLLYRKKLHTTPELQAKVMKLNAKSEIRDPVLLKKCLIVLACTISLFMLHSVLHLATATVALAGASTLMLLTFASDAEKLMVVFSRIEWLSIFFFVGLFIMVGSLIETGVINIVAAKAMHFTNGDVKSTAVLILWLSAIASAFIDNIPFVATLLPLIQEMGQMGINNLAPIYWSLALGACLGGCGTLIGASANVVVASMAAQRGKPISFNKFLFMAFPLMILAIIISNLYILWRYF